MWNGFLFFRQSAGRQITVRAGIPAKNIAEVSRNGKTDTKKRTSDRKCK